MSKKHKPQTPNRAPCVACGFRIFGKILVVATIVASSGCGFAYRNTIGLFYGEDESQAKQSFKSQGDSERGALGEDKQTRSIDIEALPTDDGNEVLGAVEIIWEIPESPADAFIIHYGFEREDLDQEERVDSEDLERYEDPRHGFVYRHLINDIPLSKALFVAMATVRGEQVSELTEVFEVQAMKKASDE